jgi:probable HAF family extracellular repeat protein
VNDLRQVIGVFTDSTKAPHAFLLRNGVYKQLDLPDGLQTVPFSINNSTVIVGQFVNVAKTTGHGYLQLKNNNRNQIVGFYSDKAKNFHNFLLQDKKLTQLVVPKSFKASFASFQTINDSDEIVGYYNDAQQVAHGFVAKRAH